MLKKKTAEFERVQWTFTNTVKEREETELGSASLVFCHGTDNFYTKWSLRASRKRADAALGCFAFQHRVNIPDYDVPCDSSQQWTKTLWCCVVRGEKGPGPQSSLYAYAMQQGEMEILAGRVGATNHRHGIRGLTMGCLLCTRSALGWKSVVRPGEVRQPRQWELM